MSLIRWGPYGQMRSLRDTMDRLFEESARHRRGGEGQEMESGLYIPMDVYESGDYLVISAVAPGVKPEDLDVNVSGNTLTIRGEIKPEGQAEGRSIYFQERAYGPFSRTITLSSEYDLAKIDASCHDGVIRIMVPRSEEAKPKQIKVKAAQSS